MSSKLAILLLLILILLLIFLFKAMKSRYCVEMDFKIPACKLHLDIKPTATCTDTLDEDSTSRTDTAIKT